MSFRSITPRRAGLLVLVRTTSAARRQVPLQVSINRRSIPCLDHRQCLYPVTRVSHLDPQGLHLSFSGLSCPLRSRLHEDFISL